MTDQPAPSQEPTRRHPTEINLHSKSRMLSIAFDDGARFELPCAETRVRQEWH